MVQLETDRLYLRQWQESDRLPFAALNADPKVMEFFPNPLDRAASDEMFDRIQALIADRGWGFWAATEKTTQQFIGFVGLHIPSAELPFSPAVEVGWRLAHAYWGRGYAPEAAKAALQFGFARLQLPEIVAYTTVSNQRSQSVMKKIGMTPDPLTFEHPALPAESPLRTHCIYRLTRENHALLVGER
jgi:RimJ/RimL family protein N-acetyltransferase